MSYSETVCGLPPPETVIGTDDSNSYPLGITLELGVDKYKWQTKNVLAINDNYDSAYEMRIWLRHHDGKWRTLEGIRGMVIEMHGDYERSNILSALQHIGLMTLPTYGRMELKPLTEEYDDAVCE